MMPAEKTFILFSCIDATEDIKRCISAFLVWQKEGKQHERR
jgi:hypothetical protein